MPHMPGCRLAYFNPRSPRGERLVDKFTTKAIGQFQSTLPARGATSILIKNCATVRNFNPRSPRGERPRPRVPVLGPTRFQSTLPARGATVETARRLHDRHHFNPRSPRGERHSGGRATGERCTFQSTLPARGATDLYGYKQFLRRISIHAPREGSDIARRCICRRRRHFNPRSPRGERQPELKESLVYLKFQSTLPARGATQSILERTPQMEDFNPRSPRGERHVDLARHLGRTPISIHAPREGSDVPCGLHRVCHSGISIHAPREGSDRTIAQATEPTRNFNPRSPRGERRQEEIRARSRAGFQSTLPARGATVIGEHSVVTRQISIHAPREGSDYCPPVSHAGGKNFNPRSPRGERCATRVFLK